MYNNNNQNKNDDSNILSKKNNELFNIKNNNINNNIFTSNISINNKKPIIIKKNTYEDKLNYDNDISFIEEITDLLKTVDEKKKDNIDKNILNENSSNETEKSSKIKPDLNQIKIMSYELRPITSYGNIDVRNNNLKKKNEILK